MRIPSPSQTFGIRGGADLSASWKIAVPNSFPKPSADSWLFGRKGREEENRKVPMKRPLWSHRSQDENCIWKIHCPRAGVTWVKGDQEERAMNLLFTCQGWKGRAGLGRDITEMVIRAVRSLEFPEAADKSSSSTYSAAWTKSLFRLFYFAHIQQELQQNEPSTAGPASWACNLASCTGPRVYKGSRLG